jgi:hypothetical protein
MRAGRTMGFTICERYFVSYHTAAPPTDEEWRDQLVYVDGRMAELRGVLVVADGGGPNVVQRKQLAELFQGKLPPVAVITESAMVRGMLVALSWFGLKQRAFAPADFEKALQFLGANGHARTVVTKAIEQLRADVADTCRATGNDS